MPTDISVPFKYNLDNYLPGAGFNRTDSHFNPMEFSKFVEYSHIVLPVFRQGVKLK